MSRMLRTQVCLEPELGQALDRLARRRGTSKGTIIREAIRRHIQQEQNIEDDPIWGLIGMAEGEPGNVSEEHDRVLVEEFFKRHHR